MKSIFSQINARGFITPQPWLENSIQYETLMGSISYGASDDKSDKDVYGFCIPPLEVLFPHLVGDIRGFNFELSPEFNQFQKHHIKLDGDEIDISIYNIVKYFQLCLECNPNMIDSLYTDDRFILFNTDISKTVRNNRHLFLHKGLASKFKGYALSQINKIGSKNNSKNEKRSASIEAYGYDTKLAYHTIRLVLEAVQLLEDGTMDLKKHGDIFTYIRQGKWSLESILNFTNDRIRLIDDLKIRSHLPDKPQVKAVKKMLIDCIEGFHKIDLQAYISFPIIKGLENE